MKKKSLCIIQCKPVQKSRSFFWQMMI